MIVSGTFHSLAVLRCDDSTVVLAAGTGQALLPGREAPAGVAAGDRVDVFVWEDGDGRLRATTRPPLARPGDVAALRVVSVAKVGAFLDWGLPKDLLLPFGEQRARPEPGAVQVVKVVSDRDGRPVASARLDRWLEQSTSDYRQGEAVRMVVVQKTDLGYKVAVEGRVWGLVHGGEVRSALRRGQTLTGYVQRLRPDGRLSLSLNPPGTRRGDELGDRILEVLERAGGFLPLHDRSDPGEIFEHLRCSKSAFKQAAGKLYRERRILLCGDGIRSVPAED